MKFRINRETTIGLSVLLILLIILGVVAVRRFFRPHIPAEAIAVMEEVKRAEEPAAERARHEMEWPQKPDSLFPVAATNQDHVPTGEDREHRNNGLEERRRETPPGSSVPSLITSNPPLNAKLDRREHERAEADSAAGPPAADNRYGLETFSAEKHREMQPATPSVPLADSRIRDGSSSMVVQVGGDEQAERALRSSDRYADEAHAHPTLREHRDLGPAADALGAAADLRQRAVPDGTAAGMSFANEAARKLVGPQATEERRVEERRAEERQVGERHGEERRFGRQRVTVEPGAQLRNDSTFSAPPGNGSPNDTGPYSGVPGGYTPDNALRPSVEASASLRTENRLRDDGKYEVQPNDSYWTISERVYGSGAYFRALAEQNRGKAARPDRLASRAGDFHASRGATGEGLSGSLPPAESPRNRAKPGRPAAWVREHGQHGRRRTDLRRAGRRHLVEHRPQRIGKGLTLGGNLPAQSRGVGQGLRLPDARHAACAADIGDCTTRGDDARHAIRVRPRRARCDPLALHRSCTFPARTVVDVAAAEDRVVGAAVLERRHAGQQRRIPGHGGQGAADAIAEREPRPFVRAGSAGPDRWSRSSSNRRRPCSANRWRRDCKCRCRRSSGSCPGRR